MNLEMRSATLYMYEVTRYINKIVDLLHSNNLL